MSRLRWPELGGFVGSALLGLGALGIGWVPPLFDTSVNPLVDFLRNSDPGRLASHVCVVVGGGLLLQAWLLLGLQTLSSTESYRTRTLLTLWFLPVLFVPPVFTRDPFSYIAQARLLLNGFNPYRDGVSALPGWFALGVDPAWAETPTPYGPFFLLLSRLVVGVTPNDPMFSMVGFRLLAVAGVVLLGTAVVQLARLHGINERAALWLAVLNPLVLMHFVLAAHNDALMIGLIAWAFVFGYRKQWLPAWFCVFLAAGVKPIALLALPFVVMAHLPREGDLVQRLRWWISSALGVMGALWLSGAAMGIGMGWIQALTTPGEVRTFLSPSTALGQLIGSSLGFFNVDAVEQSIAISRIVFEVIALALVARLLVNPAGRSPLRGAALAFTILVACSPVVQVWYLLWALSLVAAAGLARAWHLRAVVLGTAFFVLYSLTEANIVTDSSIGVEDLAATAAAALVTLAVLLVSPAERALALGKQFASGLRPVSAEQKAAAEASLVRS